MENIPLRYKSDPMGHVYADVELINGEDLLLSKRHIIGEDEVKRMPVRILVDTGAFMLTINESIQEQLQIPFMEKKESISGRWPDNRM